MGCIPGPLPRSGPGHGPHILWEASDAALSLSIKGKSDALLLIQPCTLKYWQFKDSSMMHTGQRKVLSHVGTSHLSPPGATTLGDALVRNKLINIENILTLMSAIMKSHKIVNTPGIRPGNV